MRLSYLRFYTVILLSVAVFFSSCAKQKAVQGDFAVLHIFGAISNDDYVVTNFKGAQPINYYSQASRIQTIDFAAPPNKYYISNSPQPLAFYTFPDTLPGIKPMLNMELNLQMGEAYTLFLAGSNKSLDSMLIKETIPVLNESDSVSAVRFVNLCNTAPISVNLKGKPYGSAVQSLPYKGITGYVNYPAGRSIDTYEFEIRDAASGNLITTYVATGVNGIAANIYYWLGKARTHVLTGTPGVSTGANRVRICAFLLN